MHIDSYLIRMAEIADAEAIAQVHVKAWRTSYAGIIDSNFLENISFEQRLQLRKEILQSSNGYQLVALFEDHLVGFADAGLMREEKPSGRIGEIYAINILQEHQGQGIGQEFFARCRQWFQCQDIGTFVLWALRDNARARKFYEKQGGEIVGERLVTIGDGELLEYRYRFPLQSTNHSH